MRGIHGGDIYRNHINMDFSVNVNPFGIPEAVEKAMHEAVRNCSQYPDIRSEQLKRAVSRMWKVPEQYLLFGNGASELFMAVMHGIRPKKTIIPVPSFYGYEHAANAAGGEIIYYETKQEDAFALKDTFLSVLTEDVGLVFLANPNNPTGHRLQKRFIRALLSRCLEKGIYIVLDECFIEFCGEDASMLQEIEAFPNLIIVRAFTKIFAIPGVRLGYLICSDPTLLERISSQLPEWNVSGFAQAAGCECAEQTAFIEKTVDDIKREREYLENGLRQSGFVVYPGDANYLFLYSEQPLYEQLLEKGILIRDCSNFRGLTKGYYRIAIRTRKENEMLLQELRSNETIRKQF